MPTDTAKREMIVLVHGLWMRGWLMACLAWRLRRGGFQVVSYSYPSVRSTLSENAFGLARFVSGLEASRIHLVGHSLGGLVLLQMLASYPDARMGRVVLLGCPYRSSFAASKLCRSSVGRRLVGRSIAQWLGHIAPINIGEHEIGVIAGSQRLGAGRLIGGIPQPNDGVVMVAETQLNGARDQIVLKVCHSCMLVSAEVARQACAFLRQGYFLHDTESK